MSSTFRKVSADKKHHQAEELNAGRELNVEVERALKYN